MSDLTVDVTATDIRLGLGGSISNCAVARAIKRKFAEPVTVGFAFANVGYACYNIPERVQMLIRRIVDGETVKPFTFTLKPHTLI